MAERPEQSRENVPQNVVECELETSDKSANSDVTYVGKVETKQSNHDDIGALISSIVKNSKGKGKTVIKMEIEIHHE